MLGFVQQLIDVRADITVILLAFLHVVTWPPPLQTPQSPSGQEKGTVPGKTFLGTTQHSFADVYLARTGSHGHPSLQAK